MLKRILKSDSAVSLTAKSVASYIRFIYATSSVIRDPADTHTLLIGHAPCIIAMWHGQVMMVPKIKPKKIEKTVHTIVARHGDGHLMGSILEQFDFVMIRGAGANPKKKKDKGGVHVLRESLKALKEGHYVALTADFPPGPGRQAGDGIVTMAKLSGCPIIPVAMATSNRLTLNNWDRFTINLPFSRLSVIVGEPIHVDRKLNEAETEQARQQVEQELNRVTQQAYEIIGESADKVLNVTPKEKESTQPGLQLKAYRLLTRLARPLAPLILSRRAKRGKEDLSRSNERLGKVKIRRPDGHLTWVHAASVGETNAILPLIHALNEKYPEGKILLTTGTVTSAKLAQQRLPQNAIHQFIPLDATKFVDQFLDHWRPNLALFVESEVWPNLILQSSTRQIPMVLVNGRMSDKSYNKWKKQKGLSKPLFSRFDLILAQNEQLANRFKTLGAPQTLSSGNLKADCPAPPISQSKLEELKHAIQDRPIFTAASTHPGEEKVIAEVHEKLKTSQPDLLTIIIPRHPDRAGDISKILKEKQLSHAIRSSGHLPRQKDEFYIADTIGELGTFYALSPLAFIGGSLIEHGGQNPIEAIKRDTAVITGPYWHNFIDAYEALHSANACIEATDANQIAKAAQDLMADHEKANALRNRASDAVNQLGGALNKTMQALEPFMPKPSSPKNEDNEPDLKRAS